MKKFISNNIFTSMVDIGSDLEVEELRLVDEAFGKICNMINDLSLEVKVQAAKSLVNFQIIHKKKNI